MDSRQRRRLLVGGVVLVAVAVVVGGAVALGVGPFGQPGDSGGGMDGGAGDGETSATTTTAIPTGTVYTRTPGAGEELPPFSFTIDRIEECGRTCRDVTVTLYNNQNDTARNVTVYTRIYAGNSTAEGDRVWKGQEDVGTMAANSSATRTQRVDLTTSEAFKVQQNDGWITIVTTIRSDEATITFKNRRDVA